MRYLQLLQPWLIGLCAVLTGVIFIADLLTPLGIANVIPYVLVVLLSLWLPEPRYTMLFATVCTILVVLGFFISPPGGLLWMAIPNRTLVVLIIWATALLGLQRKQMEMALMESEAKARAILNTTADAIVIMDESGRIESFNRAAERIFQYPAAEALNQDISMLLPRSMPVELDAALHDYLDARCRQTGGIGHEVIGRRKDGSAFPMEFSVSKVQVNGRYMFTGIIRDITARRQLEQEVLRISEDERRRIGYDLSEGLGQMLTGISLINQNLSRTLRAEQHPSVSELDRVTEWLREADRFAIDLVHGLLPVDVDATGLSVALARLAKQTTRLFGVQCTFEETGTVLIDNNTAATHLYMIAREAANHAIKHDEATAVSITLGCIDGQVQLRIQDNGKACAAGQAEESRNLALHIMQYRACMIGAALEIRRVPAGETTVTCMLQHPELPAYETNPDPDQMPHPAP